MSDASALSFEQRAVNSLRILSIEEIEKAHSGHPGIALGAAPIIWTIYTHAMKHNPHDPDWLDRDRFVLSAGHASSLLYALLYLFDYGLQASDLASFRQLHSITPGHPEWGLTPGVEASTGPLGQGAAMAVGMALAEKQLAARFNTEDQKIIDHYTYVLMGDGCPQEGVSGEAASFAGQNHLGKLIVVYDRNQVTIDGHIDVAFSEDVAARYRAYGWQTLEVADANNIAALSAALEEAKADQEHPSLIVVQSKIGYASPLEDDPASHGAPLGAENIRATKEKLGWPLDLPELALPEDILPGMRPYIAAGEAAEADWEKRFASWTEKHPELRAELDDALQPDLSFLDEEGFFGDAPQKDEATRNSSSRVLNKIAAAAPWFLGGSADLAGSNKTWLKGSRAFSAADPLGRNIHYGIREFAMGCIANGIVLHGGLRAFTSTFLAFSDYMRSAIRAAAIMRIPSLFIFTHDSIGVGEDGPTHQPIEQLASLRAIPDLLVMRPADFAETCACYRQALREKRPTALILSRQNLPQLEQQESLPLQRGAYILRDCQGRTPELILLASGSELGLCAQVWDRLTAEGIAVRLISVPCLDLFLEQDAAYREQILPASCPRRLAVEAAASMPWYQLVGSAGKVHGIDHFGLSAPAAQLMAENGFTPDVLYEEARALLSSED